MPFRWVLLLLAVVAPAPATTRRRVNLWAGRDHPFSTLHEAVVPDEVVRCAVVVEPSLGARGRGAKEGRPRTSDEVVVINLAPGRHYVGQPLELDRRHDNLVFLGHGTAELHPIISGGGRLNLSSALADVGPAHCAGCTQVWRAQTLKGVDSRQFYVNARVNRTWAPFAPVKNIMSRRAGPLLLKTDDEGFTMPRWLGMFNEAEPSNISAAAFSAQRPFANLFFHWNVSLLTEIHERFHPNKPGLFLSMQTWGVWHLPALKWRNQNETGLKLHWRDSLNAGLAEAEPHLRSGVLSGIFLGDELGTQGIPFANITSVADVIHKTLVKTGGLSYLNEGTGPFDPQHPRYAGTWGKHIPSSVDLFSIDDYCLLRPDKFDIGWANCSDPAAEAQRVQVFMAEHVKPRMTPHQRLLLVPGLFLDANISRSGPLAQQEQLMIRKLDAYFDWAKTDHQVVGLNGWHWTTLPDHRTDVQMIPFYWGVDHMKSLQLRLAQIGQLIKAANNTQSSRLQRVKTDDGRPWSVGTVSWLVEPASLKLKQSQPSSPLPSSTRVIDLALQAGECESRQLRLRSSMGLHQVVVELPTLVGHWTARQVGYVYARSATMYNCSGADAMNATDDAPCTAGWRPDPLLSSSDGVVVPRIPPGTTQPIFITLCVPSAAAAGSAVAQLRVRGRLGATTTASLIADVPVNVEIWPIALPATNDSQSMSTMFGVDAAIWKNSLWRDNSGRGRGPTAAVLRQSWHNFLHQYRLPAGNPYIYEGPLSFDDVTELSASGAKNINLMYVPLHGAPKKVSYNSSDLAIPDAHRCRHRRRRDAHADVTGLHQTAR
jgi:hypothetical protein